MIRRTLAAAAALTLIGACGGSGANERQVLVDYTSDDVTMFLAQNFPKKVEALPGQTIVFKQTWTGEPHTVTGGRAVDDILRSGSDFLTIFTVYQELATKNPDLVNPEEPGDATVADFANALKAAKPASKSEEVLAVYDRLRVANGWPDFDNPPSTPFSELNDKINTVSEPIFESLLFAFDEEAGGLAQNVGQPCFLDKGMPPEDAGKACSKTQQTQPDFDGTQNFYNSGVLRYEGARGNTFKMKLADETKPGKYFFYCAVHGPGQLTELTVGKPGSDVPSASATRRAAEKEAEAASLPLEQTYRDALRTGRTEIEGEEVSGPFAGLPTSVHGSINEFVPRTIRAKAGEPITWKMIGADHTISFDVPPYLPIIQFGKKFRLNPKIENPAGGAPALPEHEDEEGGGEEGGEAPEPPKIDGGTYDGSGFWSSGLVGGGPYLSYTLRISKPGSYPYACLIHPRMIGRVIVS